MWRCEVADIERLDVYDAIDIFLDYNDTHSDEELHAHTEWVWAHPEFVKKYHRQFVVLELPEYKALHHCTNAREFSQYLETIPRDKRHNIFIYHSELFTPKYWTR